MVTYFFCTSRVFQEVKTYGLNEFLSDFGGFTGGILGLSIWGLYEMASEVIGKLTKMSKLQE